MKKRAATEGNSDVETMASKKKREEEDAADADADDLERKGKAVAVASADDRERKGKDVAVASADDRKRKGRKRHNKENFQPLPGYHKIEDFKSHPAVFKIIREVTQFAITKYNEQKGVKYVIQEILTAYGCLIRGIGYYVTFYAQDQAQGDTGECKHPVLFEAKIFSFYIEREVDVEFYGPSDHGFKSDELYENCRAFTVEEEL